ncbi:MAG: OadG family transporter subunit [Methylovulum sp.]|nr:OadG family transporter subunit [Methylovulum sp.]
MAELMSSGIELMFAGMGIVFLFLTMLVFAINLMSSLVQRFFPEAPPTPATPHSAPSNIADKATVAAIIAAVHQYRQKK